MKNNDKNLDEIPSENPNKKINIFRENTKSKHEYKNIYLCPLNKHDIVNSMEILDDIIIYGTIMGNVYLCRINSNNLIPKIKKQNNSENNYDINNNEIKNINIDSSKISCIKLDVNSNNKSISNDDNNYTPNKKGIKNDKDKDNKDKNFYDSDIIPTTKSVYNKLINSEINTKRRLLNKIKLNDKNSQSSQNSLISQSNNSKLSEELTSNPEIVQLVSNANENIPCLSFDTKDVINVSIGDADIIRFENISNFNFDDDNENYYYTQIKNYQNENDHIKYCEGATCLMHKNNFLLLLIPLNDYNSLIHYQKYFYINKTLTTYEVINGEINMYNFMVPFDFDGDRFLYLEYESETIRRICIYYTLKNMGPDIFKINKSFGHISFMKFIDLNKIIICKKNKYCEIRDINADFKLVESYEHIGDEIIAMNIYIKNSNEKMDNSMTELTYKTIKKKNNVKEIEYADTNCKKNKNAKNKNNKIGLNDNIYGYDNKPNLKKFLNGTDKINNSTFRDLIGLNNKNQIKSDKEISIYDKNKYTKEKEKDFPKEIGNKKTKDYFINDKEYMRIKKNNISYEAEQKLDQTEKNIDDDLYIITVDKNGNFNLYHNGTIKTVFNLYNINNIEQKYKDEQFFSLGFPYFVLMNNKYYAISTDHGIFILTNNNKI